MKKSRTERNLKRRVKTRKVMIGGEGDGDIKKPVSKDVIDSLKKLVDNMEATGEYPTLKTALQELIRLSEKVDDSTNTAASNVNTAASNVNTDTSNVNADASNVNTDTSNVNASAPSASDQNESAPPAPDQNASAVAPASAAQNANIMNTEMISYNGGRTSTSYEKIKKMLVNTILKETDQERKTKINDLLNKIKEAKNVVEVQNIMNEFGNFEEFGKGGGVYYKIGINGGTRKRKNRRNRTQRKRAKTLKIKKKVGKRK